MGLMLVQVDAFTSEPFAGNPAAVCLLREERPDRWLQAVAAEMNLSETAFLLPRQDGYGLRWFTPRVEVDLCGHATLASAHVLWESGRLAHDAIARFHTRSGPLSAVRRDPWIELDFPAVPDEPCDAPAGLAAALGARPLYVGRNRFDLLVELDNEEVVRGLRPDLSRLAELGGRGVIVTSRSSAPGTDFVSRFFAPAAGVDEDPVTGSAHCCLAPFWSARLGQSRFVARQISARGGVLRVELAGDRVLLAGQAVTVLRGEIIV